MYVRECLTVIWVAMLPVLELRAAIPLGVSIGLSPWLSFACGTVGSMLPVPFVLLAFKPLGLLLRRKGVFAGFLDKYQDKAAAVRGGIRRYGLWALTAFVAVPLPSTGAWTGAILASILGLRFWPSFLAILAGTTVAGLIVTWAALGIMVIGGSS